jgi:hypothetical protein
LRRGRLLHDQKYAEMWKGVKPFVDWFVPTKRLIHDKPE